MSLSSSSQFRRSGQRDDRRRLLLGESAVQPARRRRARKSADDNALGIERKSLNYGDADFMDEQPRLIDLVPRRLTTLLAWLVVGILCIAGLEALYSWMPHLAGMTGDGQIATFDLDDEGSLAVWFSSVTLLAAAGMAVIVYTIRRWKVDDYGGNYRVWLWAALCCVLLSVDETASLHEGFKKLMIVVTGTTITGNGSIWWALPYGFLLGAVGSRLLVDMWPARLSTGAFIATAVCYAVAVVAELQWILPEAGARGVMVEEGAEMLGDVFLLLAMTLHARYVILDAEGLLPPPKPKKKKIRASKREEQEEEEASPKSQPWFGDASEDAATDEWIRVEEAHPSSQSVLKRRRAAELEIEEEEDEDPEPVASPVQRKLTKQEKKALRRRLAQERAKREQKQQKNW